MNICFITARILSKPQRQLQKGNYITFFNVSFPYKHKILCFAEVIACGKISQSVFDLYFQGDYVVIEGKLITLKSITNRKLVIDIIDIHPARIIVQK